MYYSSYEWLVMPFGLTNAPTAFQRFVNTIFTNLLDVSLVVYLNNILTYSKDLASHQEHVHKVLRRLWKQGLYANPKKCKFHTDTTEYLGYVLSPARLTMSTEKVKAIQDWPKPCKVKDVQSFLGFANFYWHFIHKYSDIVVPLTCLACKGTPWVFSDDCHSAFCLLKDAFTSTLILTHPITRYLGFSPFSVKMVRFAPSLFVRKHYPHRNSTTTPMTRNCSPSTMHSALGVIT